MIKCPTRQIPPQASPRSWLSSVSDIFGYDYMARLYGLTERSYRKWTPIPGHVGEDSMRTNYIEKHEHVLTRLVNDGYDHLARSIVSRHAALVGCAMVPLGQPEPDKDTIEEEMLDDYPSLVALHQAIQEGKDRDTIAYLANEIVSEIYETVEKYHQSKE